MGSRDHAWSIFCDICEYKYREFSLKWNQGVGLGELLLAVTRSQLRPSRKTGTLLWILCNYYFTVPAGRGKPTAQPIRDNLSSANEKPPYLVFLVSSSGLFVYSILPQLPPCRYKQPFPPLFGGIVYGFAIVYLSCIDIFCCLWINLCFAGKAIFKS